MKIGICDDSPEMREILKDKIIKGNYIQGNELQEFSSALEIIEKQPQLDLLFLDIEMPEMTGMELMRQHSELFSNTKVVFLTSYTDYMMDGYEVNAYRYLLKPVREDKLRELFDSLDKEKVLNGTLEVVKNSITIELPYKDIVCLAAHNNYVDVVSCNDRWRCYKTLKELEHILPEQYFYRTHKSFIINMKWIKDIINDGKTIIMCNDEMVDVTIRNTKKFAKRYSEFMLENN